MTYWRNELDDLLWQEEQKPVYLNQRCCVPSVDWTLRKKTKQTIIINEQESGSLFLSVLVSFPPTRRR